MPTCLCCERAVPREGPRRCPECDHSFGGTGWGGIDAHWRRHHEEIRSYEDFWTSLCDAHRGSAAPGERPDFTAIARSGHRAQERMLAEKSDDAFVELLRDHPRDGMLYFLRGQAFERLGDERRAFIDFALAEHLFPMDRWKREAAVAKARVGGRQAESSS